MLQSASHKSDLLSGITLCTLETQGYNIEDTKNLGGKESQNLFKNV